MRTGTGTALVAGAAGIIGHALLHELDRKGWRVRGLSRRRLPGRPSIPADLTDADATAAALRDAADTTHVFYAALAPDPDLATEAARNAASGSSTTGHRCSAGWGVARQVDEPETLGHDQVRRGMPAGVVELKHDHDP